MRSLSLDAKKTLKGKFKPSNSAERQFAKQLKKVAAAAGHIIERHTDGAKLVDEPEMQKALREYSKALTPWARRQSAKLLEQVQKSNKRAYQNKSKAIGTILNEGAATGPVMSASLQMLNEQVNLIKSIPIEAGLRAQKIAFEAATHGMRAFPDQDTIDELQKQLGMSTEVAINRARLIARTETARATASINQSRAEAVGSNQYRWHNSGDEAVRHSHKFLKGKRLQGMIFSWDAPPTLDDGMTGHPGTFPNCRCFAEPVFADE
jgi:SPP1 gp7 family putative phage head morphogenesis protein